MPNVADVRDVGVFELGLALGVSGVVGGGGSQRWGPPIGPGQVLFFGTGDPKLVEQKKCLHSIFKHKEEMSYFSYP